MNFQFEEEKKEKSSFMPATLLEGPDMTTAICLTFNPRDCIHCRQKYYTKYQTEIVPTFDKSKIENVKTPAMKTIFRKTLGPFLL